MGLRYRVALLLAKASTVALRLTHHNGTNFPGALALRVCPDFLAECAKPERVIAITGTNGKTTCSNLVHDLLAQLGVEALNNSRGSNIDSGIATALIAGMTVGGRERYQTAVLEVDERSAARVFPYVRPDWLVVTNLSRDSIMRNAHPEYIRDFITANVPATTHLVLNADDLIASSVAPGNPRTYFGIGPMEGDQTEPHNLINDMAVCPRCYTKLRYRYLRYSNIGRAWCPACGFTSPDYDVEATDVDRRAMKMTLSAGGESASVPLMNESTFNIYNQVAAGALLHAMGYPLAKVAEAMGKVGITKSRLDCQQIGDVRVYMMLCKEKNAYADSRVFEYIRTIPGDKEVVLVNNCIGDTHHWSENTCWLYDCDFELLADDSVRHVIVYGDRGLDLRLRLLLAGVPDGRITYVERPEDVPAAVRILPNDNIFVLYGTDSFDLGMRTGERVRELVREHVGGAAKATTPDGAAPPAGAGSATTEGEGRR